MEIVVLAEVLLFAKKLADTIIGKRRGKKVGDTAALRDKEERDTAALRLLLDVLSQTRLYLGRLRRCLLAAETHTEKLACRERDTEERLSKMWTQLGADIRHLDSDLAQLAVAKGGYWADPETWSPEEIEAAGINIEDVTKAVQDLLPT